MTDPMIEMPKYQSHKIVWALKIEKFEGLIITPEQGYQPFQVSKQYAEKHKPQAGGYYVLYEGGYESFSPAEAFEKGNARLGESATDVLGLMNFYGVSTINDLVAEQQKHVRQLQERLRPYLNTGALPGRVREG